MQSGVFIIPADQLDAGNAFGEQMGWGEKSLSVPLSPTGQEPATHWGARADVSEAFLAMLADPPTDAVPLLEVLHIDLRDTGDAYGHWQDVLAGLGLQVVTDA
jgi:hypothetical protein